MKVYWKALLFTFWLLSQALGFALPAPSSMAERELPFCPAREEREAGNVNPAYDAGSVPCVFYDAEFLPPTTQALNDPAGTVPTIPAYDPCPVSAIHVAGSPRAPPVAQVGFVAAKGGVRFGQQGISATFRNGEFAGQAIEDVAAGLRSGAISPSQLPLQTITRDGITYTLNNRSLMALRQAGMEPTVLKDVTGNAFFEKQLTERLAEMGGHPPADFVPVIRPRKP